MRKGREARHTIAVVRRDTPRTRAQVLRLAARFLAASPDGRVVTFLDDFEGMALDGGRCVTSWRVCLAAGEHERHWTAAYAIADRFMARLDGAAAELLRPLYHTLADRAWQGLVSHALLADAGAPELGPVLALVPGRSPRAWRGLDATMVEVAPAADVLARFTRRLGLVAGGAWARARPRTAAHAAHAGRAGSAVGSDQPHVLIAVQEGVAAVNSPSALVVARALRDRGRGVVVLSPTRSIRDRCLAEGITILCPAELSPGIATRRWLGFALTCRRRIAALSGDPTVPSIERHVAARMFDDLGLSLLVHATAAALLDAYQRDVAPIGAGLLVNESTPASGQALAWLRRGGIPDIGYWPALLGKRPDCNYFPASRHLVYGRQLARHLQVLGIAVDRIETVGSVTFDNAVGRDRRRDVAHVRDNIVPHWPEASPLVVVGTEALPEPMQELAPVLEALAVRAEVTIVLKLHPADRSEPFVRWLAGAGLSHRVAVVERCDLEALLHAADLLVCVLSNIIVSAALLGTPTLVCDFSDKRRPLDFVAEGLALGCFAAADVPGMIGDLLPGGRRRAEALDLLPIAVKGFNDPADGRSAERIVEILLAMSNGKVLGAGSAT